MNTTALPRDSAPPPVPGHGEDAPPSPRQDFLEGLMWIAFGAAVAIAAWRMDRLTEQNINPYTVPGLLPGLLGLAVMFFGALFAWRAWRAGGLADAGTASAGRGNLGMTWAELGRFALTIVLCVVFSVALLGQGMPFWLTAAIYTVAAIVTLQYPQRRAAGQLLRGLVLAIVIGIGSGFVITIVFQDIFLVRLP
jgi:hypothetical protein